MIKQITYSDPAISYINPTVSISGGTLIVEAATITFDHVQYEITRSEFTAVASTSSQNFMAAIVEDASPAPLRSNVRLEFIPFRGRFPDFASKACTLLHNLVMFSVPSNSTTIDDAHALLRTIEPPPAT